MTQDQRGDGRGRVATWTGEGKQTVGILTKTRIPFVRLDPSLQQRLAFGIQCQLNGSKPVCSVGDALQIGKGHAPSNDLG
mmetsp:Transcript_625/g.4237  ORF Transcript_625/g.4237 Transcript_625/m.4237 type:complete len:80 (+) Transcript_625:221-460(+)